MNNAPPFLYTDNMMSSYFNLQPSEVRGRANVSTEYWRRFLYAKMYSVFKFTLPDEWKLNFFRYCLFHLGSLAVIYTNEFGWVAQPYSIAKVDLYYNPLEIVVANQFFKAEKHGRVGLNCGIVHAMDDFYGLDDIVSRYAVKLAQCDKSIDINLMNANVAMAFAAEDKKQAETIKNAYSEATTGKPLVTINKNALGEGLKPFFPSVSNTFIADKILDAQQTIVNQFLTTIGIRNANYSKKERLNSAEVNENNDDTSSIVSVILDNIKKDFDAINKISGLNLSVELRYTYDEEGNNNDENDVVGDE